MTERQSRSFDCALNYLYNSRELKVDQFETYAVFAVLPWFWHLVQCTNSWPWTGRLRMTSV